MPLIPHLPTSNQAAFTQTVSTNTVSSKTRLCLLFFSILFVSLMSVSVLAPISAQAAPTVTVTDANGQPVTASSDSATGTPSDANTETGQSPAQNATEGQTAKTSPAAIQDTLISQLQPSERELSAANQELLSRNAQLQRQINDLQTQVNVLVNERSGQLFMYGAFTVIISLLVGVFISWLVFVRRERW